MTTRRSDTGSAPASRLAADGRFTFEASRAWMRSRRRSRSGWTAPEGKVRADATRTIDGSPLRAPALVDFETANIIRRHEIAGDISADQAAQADLDFQDLTIERWPYDLLADRSWQL